MYLTEQQILDFQKILEEDFGEKVSYDEASECAYDFFALGLALYEREGEYQKRIAKDSASQQEI